MGVEMNINVQADMLEGTKTVRQTVISADGSAKKTGAAVVREHFLDVLVNEKKAVSLVCTPSDLAELVLGRLLTDKLISDAEDVESIYLCEKGAVARVFLKRDLVMEEDKEIRETTCCTGNRTFLKNSRGEPLPRMEKANWRPEWIFALTQAFARDSKLHRETAGTHSCYLSAGGSVLFHSEDIGRHNAMDKCIGYAVRKGIPRKDCILFTTGRVPTDMVQKAIAAGIPVLVSKSVPTDAAVDMAAQYGLTLICRAWPDSFAVFSQSDETWT